MHFPSNQQTESTHGRSNCASYLYQLCYYYYSSYTHDRPPPYPHTRIHTSYMNG